MKKILLLILLSCISLPVFCESVTVAVVDVQKVISESSKGRAAKAVLQKEVEKREGVLSSMSKEVKDLKNDLAKQASVLASDALRKKQEEIEILERRFERILQDDREELAKKNAEQIGKVIADIKKVIGSIADERKLSLVLEKGSREVVYSSDSLDITKEVMLRMDQ